VDFVEHVLRRTTPAELLHALDSQHPAEERVGVADAVITKLAATSRLGRWVPMHHILNKLEYSSAFYAGYRDHTIHSLQTCLLGWYLYLHCGALRTALLATLRVRATDAGALSDFELFHEWWTLASLWHDLGYPFEATAIVTDNDFRGRVLAQLSDDLGSQPFRGALATLTTASPTEATYRQLYRHGGYFPWRLQHMDELLHGEQRIYINELWQRLGATSDDPSQSIVTLTTQAPPDRPPYYDHGHIGALLVATWWLEIERFAMSFAAANAGIDPLVPPGRRDDAAFEVMTLGGPAVAAVEAIAFHNLSLRQWPDTELHRLFADRALYRKPSLNTESHLVFLALCDTLQDWGRHHFAPTTVAKYRPAVPASAMLLQARDDGIAVHLEGRDAVADIHRLFADWLSDDVFSLFLAGAEFSRPALVASASGHVSISDVSESRDTRRRIETLIIALTASTRADLISNPDTAILRFGAAIDDGLSEVRRLEPRVLPRERDELYESAAWRHFITVQQMVASSVGIGTQVAQGYITSRIGDGGFGVVYLVARNDRPDLSPVAYKVYHSADLSNRAKRELFRRGFEAMRKLADSPGVVDVYEFTDFPVGFFMRLVNGPDMLVALAGDKDQGARLSLDVHQRLRLLEQIAQILVYAHNHNVVHRDVKPANVILDADQEYRPVLTDFDLAWISGRSTITSAAYVSMRYGAPEQFEERLAPLRNRPTVDIFSFGALSYFALTDQEPPPLGSFVEGHWVTVRNRLNGHLLGVAIEELIALIQECTQKDAAKRPATMNTVRDRLSRIRQRGFDENRILATHEFLKEMQLEYSGRSGVDIRSATGACAWHVSSSDRQLGGVTTLVLELEVELLREPRMEGVDFEGYGNVVRTRIDKVIERAKQGERGSASWVRELVRKKTTSNRKWLVSASGFVCNQRNAVRMAHLMSEITAIIE
jgi:serine/threonine protein kinase